MIDQLIRQLKSGDFPPLTLLLGTETVLQERAVEAFLATIPEEQRAMNVGRYDMTETPVAVAIDDARSMPFFGEQRLVIIESPYFLTGQTPKTKVEHDLEGLLAYFETPVESTMLVIVAPYEKLDERKKLTKRLKKNALFVETKPLTEAQTRKAVTQVWQQQGTTFDQGALDTLIARTNGDYSTTMHELSKLTAYAVNGATLSADAVASLVPRQLVDRVFDLVAAVVDKNAEQALALYRELLAQKEQPIKLNSLLLGQFRLLIQTKILQQRGYSQGDIASTLGEHPYRVKLAMRAVGRMSLADLQEAYVRLVDGEEAMKTGTMEQTLVFELFVLNYVRT